MRFFYMMLKGPGFIFPLLEEKTFSTPSAPKQQKKPQPVDVCMYTRERVSPRGLLPLSRGCWSFHVCLVRWVCNLGVSLCTSIHRLCFSVDWANAGFPSSWSV